MESGDFKRAVMEEMMGRQQTLLNFTAAGPVQKNRKPQKSICASLGPTFEEEEKPSVATTAVLLWVFVVGGRWSAGSRDGTQQPRRGDPPENPGIAFSNWPNYVQPENCLPVIFRECTTVDITC